MKRPQVCGASKLGKKTNGPTISFTTRKQTPRETPPQTPPRRSWIPRPRMEVEPPFASGGPGAFHPGLGRVGGPPKLVRFFSNAKKKLGNFSGNFPLNVKQQKIRLMNSGSIFWGRREAPRIWKSVFTSGWILGPLDTKIQVIRNSQWRKMVQKIRFQKLGVLENWKDSTSIQIIILFLTCFVRAFPSKPRLKTPLQVFAIKNGDVNPLPPSLPTKKNNRSPRLQHAQDREVGDKVLIFSRRDTEVIRACVRQRPASTHMFYHGKIEVMVRKSCDNQLRYIFHILYMWNP